MAAEKLQVSRALRVIKSDSAPIPFPALCTSGTNSSSSANKLIDAAATFITANVRQGDIVYNTTDSSAATVLSVDSETVLTLNANIFSAGSKAYKIYDSQSENNGCVLYIGGTGDVAVKTAGGDDVTFVAFPTGSFIPVQVIQIYSTGTTASAINALW